MSVLAWIAVAFLLYGATSVAAGYVAALVGLDTDEGYGLVSDRNTAILLGPFGLVFCLGVLAAKRGERNAELATARHQAELRQIRAASEEVEKFLREPSSGRRG